MVTKKEEGFTLVELLIVMIVISILAGIAVLSFSGATRTSAVSACATDIRAVNAAITAYSSDYPSDLITSSNLYGNTGTLVTNGYLSPLDTSNQFDPANPKGSRYLLSLTMTSSTPANLGAPAYSWTITVAGGAGSDTWSPLGADPSGAARGVCNRVIS